ncbi:MAG: NADH-quinone oxidoreductase subunit NuoG [Gammaproteobacteria bacterium]|nr:NADH-quinone oxidoreductase subunit NuoG [Gammaproteobacteria bacterium]
MATIEINGKLMQVRDGSMIIEASDEAGIPIPRFCYHKKLSIAANCRMCLVDVDKAAKPLPACATPVTDGMKILTHSPKAIMAQKGVMEFLLINHPLDCPICDQGGECELQEVAMGYGPGVSRYQEKKRVVKDKDIGPLISTDMTRCIHCTRCVRFGQEIAGIMELGATGRGEHMEIGTYIEKSLVSEVSGNVIDLCPVGALTAKPSRFAARAWEMSQRPTIAPHDSIGSGLYVHVRDNQVMRVVPRENEETNETWISDRDRFSYQGLDSDDRLRAPMIKRNGIWHETDWATALEATVEGLKHIAESQGAAQIGALASPIATLEEMYLLQKLMRALGSSNIDHRLRQTDFSGQNNAPLHPALNCSIADLEQLDAALLIGSNVRKEQPIAALRMRKAALRGGRLMLLNPLDYEMSFPVAEKIVTDPVGMVHALAGIAKVLLKDAAAPDKTLTSMLTDIQVDATHLAIAHNLRDADKSVVLLGNIASAHPQFSLLESLGQLVAELSCSGFGMLPEAGNSAGAWIAGMLPHREAGGVPAAQTGLDAQGMLAAKLKAYLLLSVEPEYDCADPTRAMQAVTSADFVVALTAFRSASMDNYANVMLPAVPFTETAGTFVNAEGRWQSFEAAVNALGEARPAWKILRVLGNLLNADGFEYVTCQEVTEEVKHATTRQASRGAVGVRATIQSLPAADSTLMRIGDVPMYAVDALIRRATALQQTHDARPAAAYVNAQLAAQLSIVEGQFVQARQGDMRARLPIVLDARVPDRCVRIPAGLAGSSTLGSAFGPVELERA